MKQALTDKEILIFGLRHIYGRLNGDGYEVLSVRDEPEIDPQIVARKDELLYFFVVRTAVYPEKGSWPSLSRIKQISDHAKLHHAKPVFAFPGLTNADATTEAEKSKLYKGGTILIDFSGFQELGNNPELNN
jgi:hypothetical protein